MTPLSAEEARDGLLSDPNFAANSETLQLEEEPTDPHDEEGIELSVPSQVWSFKKLEDRSSDDSAYSNFRLRFQTFFHEFLHKYTSKRYPREPRFHGTDEVRCIYSSTSAAL